MKLAAAASDSSVSSNGHHPSGSWMNLATRYLSAAAYLRRVMLAAEIVELGKPVPRQPLPVGRRYALRVLFGAQGGLPMCAVDVGKVRHHCWIAVWQTLIRDVAAIAVLVCAAFLEPWGTAVMVAVIVAAVILAGRVRLSSPVVLAAAVGVTLALVSGWREQVRFLIPLIFLGAFFSIYLADILWSVWRVRRLWQQFPARAPAPVSAALAAEAAIAARQAEVAYSVVNGQEGEQREVPITGPGRVYYGKDGIIGAGTPFTPLTLTVPLDRPLDAARGITVFTAAQLLSYVGIHLLSQGTADGLLQGYAYHPISGNGHPQPPGAASHFTFGLPYLDVDAVVASPLPQPRKLPFSRTRVWPLERPGLPAAGALAADRSPSEHPDRHYVRASTASWDGQLVASIYANAALQGHYLRMIIRPYVLAPIVSDLKVADELAQRNPFIQLAIAAGWTIRQFLAAGKRLHALANGRGKPGGSETAGQDLRSTRELYAQLFTDNLHQQEDSDRIIRVMELKVVRVTMDYLRKCNIDIEEYERQITMHVQNNTVTGSGNIVTGGTFNSSPVTATVAGQEQPGRKTHASGT